MTSEGSGLDNNMVKPEDSDNMVKLEDLDSMVRSEGLNSMMRLDDLDSMVKLGHSDNMEERDNIVGMEVLRLKVEASNNMGMVVESDVALKPTVLCQIL